MFNLHPKLSFASHLKHGWLAKKVDKMYHVFIMWPFKKAKEETNLTFFPQDTSLFDSSTILNLPCYTLPRHQQQP